MVRSAAPVAGVGKPADKIAMASFVTAAASGTSSLGADADNMEAMPIALRTFVPPAVAAAFVGACLALSHASAVIGAGLPLN